jgi:acyl-CoA thioesterase FadM
MRSRSTRVRVSAEHVDAGNHLNWLAQLRIVQEVHFELRDELGLGLDLLKSRHGLFLVMGRIHEVAYQRQLRFNDLIDVRVTIWPSRPTCFELTAEIVSEGRLASSMNWTMPLVTMATGRLSRIPVWMIEAVGSEIPERSAGTRLWGANSRTSDQAQRSCEGGGLGAMGKA